MTSPTSPAASARHLNVLVVDDEKNIRSVLVACLESAGCRVVEAATHRGRARRRRAQRLRPRASSTCASARTTGSTSCRRWWRAALRPTSSSSPRSPPSRPRSTPSSKGARDYLPKPFTPAQIRHIVDRVAQAARARARGRCRCARSSTTRRPELDFSSEAASMRAALRPARQGGGARRAGAPARRERHRQERAGAARCTT